MESLEPGKPLSFLDHHIQCGNSLLGTTPATFGEGDSRRSFSANRRRREEARCTELKKQNKEERRGQGNLFTDLKPWEQLGNMPAAMAKLESLPDDTVDAIHEKERRYAELQSEGRLSHFWSIPI